MARGDVMHTGVKQVKFREEDNIDLSLGETLLNKRDNGGSELDSDVEASLKPVGDLEFEIEILPEFAPKISLLAYYVRDDREMVTAHIDIPIENCFPNPVHIAIVWIVVLVFHNSFNICIGEIVLVINEKAARSECYHEFKRYSRVDLRLFRGRSQRHLCKAGFAAVRVQNLQSIT